MEESVDQYLLRWLGEVHAVEREDSDQRSLGAADPDRHRDQVAELADQVAGTSTPKVGAGPTAANPNPSAAMSNAM